MFDTYVVRVIYNAGGMVLCLSLPMYLVAALLTAYAYAVTNEGSVCHNCWSRIREHLMFTGIFRLSLMNFLPILIASGFAHKLGDWSFEYISYFLAIIIFDLIWPLLLNYVEVSELHTPDTITKYGNVYSDYNYYRG